MLEYLKFSIGGYFGGYKTVKLWNDDNIATYEVIRSGLMEDVEPGTRETIENHDWLSEWDNLNVNEWDKEYVDSGICDGTQWELDFREYGKARRRIYGSNAYPPQWYRFLDWLDLLMPDMEFIAPDELDYISFFYQGDGINGIVKEQLYINRSERTLCLKKWGVPIETNNNIPRIVKSVHRYDFNEADDLLIALLDDCRNYFEEDSETESTASENASFVTIELTYHDGSKKNKSVSIEQAKSEGWIAFSESIKKYSSDVTSAILSAPLEEANEHGEYMYCKVRFGSSRRLYSYRAEDETIVVGDVVDVPVGNDGNISSATVEEIAYYNREDAPYPPEKTKFIICKHDGAY